MSAAVSIGQLPLSVASGSVQLIIGRNVWAERIRKTPGTLFGAFLESVFGACVCVCV